MTEDNGPYWVNVTFESEEMEEKLWKAWDEAAGVRDWAVHHLTTRWKAASGFPTTAQLSPGMTQFVHEREIGLQRYTLLSILNSTVTTFNRQVEVESTGVAGKLKIVTMPNIKMFDPIELVFQARSVWKRYVFEYGQISTVYGSIFLAGEWQEVLDKQAADMEVDGLLFPYLWYSASLVSEESGKYKLRFNAHKKDSKMGKRGVKKKKVRERWQSNSTSRSSR